MFLKALYRMLSQILILVLSSLILGLICWISYLYKEIVQLFLLFLIVLAILYTWYYCVCIQILNEEMDLIEKQIIEDDQDEIL